MRYHGFGSVKTFIYTGIINKLFSMESNMLWSPTCCKNCGLIAFQKSIQLLCSLKNDKLIWMTSPLPARAVR